MNRAIQTDPTCTDQSATARLHRAFKLGELVRGSVVSEIADNRGIIPRLDRYKPLLRNEGNGLLSQPKFRARPRDKTRDSHQERTTSANWAWRKERHSLRERLAIVSKRPILHRCFSVVNESRHIKATFNRRHAVKSLVKLAGIAQKNRQRPAHDRRTVSTESVTEHSPPGTSNREHRDTEGATPHAAKGRCEAACW
jgi:hypothetical protein